ncbi:MAG: ABC transporter ATP-binding protein [Cellulosilyticum sp.]|nr:ABC transporter ATP-binding protein [Cellulosilyticum sp.]
MIRLENVSLIYDLQKEQPTYALAQIHLEIKPQTFYGILGPSGSGKSSLLYIIGGVMNPTTGKVYYKGESLYEMDEERRAAIRLKEFGFIFQQHLLLPYLDVIQNVLVPLNTYNQESIDRAKVLLHQLGLEKEIHKKPNQLSGGQCQRVAIARALINNPKVILADEMTASLDYEAAKKVLRLFDEIRKEATVLFVTHDKRMIEHADETINLWDGKLGE